MGLFDVRSNIADQFDPSDYDGGGGTPPPPAPSGPGGTGGGYVGPGGGSGGNGPGQSPTAPFTPGWTPPVQPAPAGTGAGPIPTFNYSAGAFPGLPPVPQFTPLPFHLPDPKDIANDPGYQFRLKQGLDSLQASAAAKGMLRTGGTIDDFINYGQSAASQEYENMVKRAEDIYGIQEGANKDAFAPRLAGWQANANIALPAWEFPITDERQREQMIMDAWSRAVGGLQQ